jgi:hypothetical protein
MSVSLHRLEEYSDHTEYRRHVLCSFSTERFGYAQVQLTQLEDGWKFETLPQEPDFNMFRDRDVVKMELVSRIVWRMVFESPSMTDRFK